MLLVVDGVDGEAAVAAAPVREAGGDKRSRGQEVGPVSWLTTRVGADSDLFLFLPSRCILGGNAPRQVVIAVVTARIVKEVSSGGQEVVGALSIMDQSQVRKQPDFLFLCVI